MNKNAPVFSVVDSHRIGIAANLSPLVLFRSIFLNRYLIAQLAMREVTARYRGTQLGMFWSVINPLLLLAVYTFVFCGIFKAKWSTDGPQSYFSFALILFAGLTAFNLFGEIVNRAPTLVLSCPNYVKKVVFPLEILPVISLVTALSTFFASFFVLIAGQIILQGIPSWTILLFPFTLLPLLLLALALGWFLSSLGVFIRDIGQSIAFVLQVLIFITPVFYPISSIHGSLRSVLIYNPLTIAVEDFRQVVLFGQIPDYKVLLVATAMSLVLCQLGYAFFMTTKKGFADVI